MTGPVEQLEAIHRQLGDLPERLAAVLRRTEPGSSLGQSRGSLGQPAEDRPGDPLAALRKFTSAGAGLPGGGMLKPFTDAIDTYKRIKDMFDGLAELRQSLRDQASPPAAPLPWGEEQQKGFPAELKGDMPTPPVPTPAAAAAPGTSAGWPSGAAPLGPPPVGSPAAAPQPPTGPATPLRMPPATKELTEEEALQAWKESELEKHHWKDVLNEKGKTKVAPAGPEGKLQVPKFREPSQQEIDDFNNEVPVKPAGPAAGAGDSRTPSEILEDQRWEAGKADRAAARTPAGPGTGSIGQPGSARDEALAKNSELLQDVAEGLEKVAAALEKNKAGGESSGKGGKATVESTSSGSIAGNNGMKYSMSGVAQGSELPGAVKTMIGDSTAEIAETAAEGLAAL